MDDKIISQQSFSQLKELNDSLKELFQNLPKLQDVVAQSVYELSKNHWYLPVMLETPSSTIQWAKKLKDGKLDKLDKSLIKYYKKNFNSLAARIIKQFPHRKLPLEAAFKAQKRKEYYLSIPVFFSQIEGIFKEITDVRYFKTNKSFIINYVQNENISDSIRTLLNPVLEVSEFDRKQDFSNPTGLNRHDVLHGDCNDYGSEINSYKIFSLLIYINDVVYYSKNNPFTK